MSRNFTNRLTTSAKYLEVVERGSHPNNGWSPDEIRIQFREPAQFLSFFSLAARSRQKTTIDTSEPYTRAMRGMMQSYPQGHWIEDSKKIGPEMQEKALRFL
ncbi:hypothetical protein GmHk_11G032358 [Glycine max]|nr:hypothetical protein GmHk_11G032358 [Glycine max]